jgi:hypothetical protein
MDDTRCRQFFLQPQDLSQRRYEAFRAYFLDGRPLAEIADRFGYRLSSLKSMVCRFRAACSNGGPPPFFFRRDADGRTDHAAAKTATDRNRPPSPTPGS